jgi:hypothetical protein
MLDKYPFRVTVYRAFPDKTSNHQHFNSETLPEARINYLKAQSIRFATRVELAIVLDTWKDGDPKT